MNNMSSAELEGEGSVIPTQDDSGKNVDYYKALELHIQRELPGVVSELIQRELDESDWSEMLLAGPSAVATIATAFIAGSSDIATSVKMNTRKETASGEIVVLP
jgi:hypothetical protein